MDKLTRKHLPSRCALEAGRVLPRSALSDFFKAFSLPGTVKYGSTYNRPPAQPLFLPRGLSVSPWTARKPTADANAESLKAQILKMLHLNIINC